MNRRLVWHGMPCDAMPVEVWLCPNWSTTSPS